MSSINVLLPVIDDSTLFAASILARELEERGALAVLAYVHKGAAGELPVSERQAQGILGGRSADFLLSEKDVSDENFLANFDAVLASKLPDAFRRKYLRRAWRFSTPRPLIGACFPGVEFTPERGIQNRRFLDLICFNSASDMEVYRRIVPEADRRNQSAIKYSPLLLRRSDRMKAGPIRKVYFFAQAIVPETLAGRIDMLRLVNDCAIRHPDKAFVVKLRHLRGENVHHVHREAFSYEWLVERGMVGPLAPNVAFSAASMRECLEDADYALTCSSTAALEALAHGVPAAFFLDYEGPDRLNGPARSALTGSGLILSRQEVLNLTVREPAPAWMNGILSDPGDMGRVLEIIRAFRERQGSGVAPMIYPSLMQVRARQAISVAKKIRRKLLAA